MFAVVSEDDSIKRFDAKLMGERLSRIGKGDAQALSELYTGTKAAVFALALSYLKDRHDAEDVLHDCYVQIFTKAASYREQGNPMGWILTIAKNLCLKKLNEKAKNGPAADGELIERELTAGTDFAGVSVEDGLILKSCLGELSPEEQRIVTLHAVAGLKHRETAELLGLPLSTVLSKYSRALEKLKRLLEEELS